MTKINRIILLFITISITLFSCNTDISDKIVGSYVDNNESKKEGYLKISHVNENIYGINIVSNKKGEKEVYFEASFNKNERILNAKGPLIQMNFKFSEDYEKLYLLGESEDKFLVKK